MAEEPKEYKSTDELKHLLDEHIKGASKKDFKNELEELWRDSGAGKLYKAECSMSRRPWATHSGRYAKLKFMSVVLTKKEDIEKFEGLLKRYGLTEKEIIEAGFNKGSYENIVKEWRSTQPDNADESSDSFGSAESESGSEEDHEYVQPLTVRPHLYMNAAAPLYKTGANRACIWDQILIDQGVMRRNHHIGL